MQNAENAEYNHLISTALLEEGRRVLPTYAQNFPDAHQEFDPLFASVQTFTKGHPWGYYKHLRENAPISWTPLGKKMSGFWSATRYEHIKEIELKPDVFSSQRGGIHIGSPDSIIPNGKLHSASLNNLINMDAPNHLQLRMQQMPFFATKYVAKLRDSVSVHVDKLLDNMEASAAAHPDGLVDFVPLFAQELPLFSLCEMLGVDEEDRPKIVEWMHYLEMAHALFSDPLNLFKKPVFTYKFIKRVKEMFAYGEAVMQDRRLNPRDDLLTAIAQSKLDDKYLNQDYLDGSWLLIIFAGNDTSRNSLSGTIRLLTEFQDQRQMVLEDPALISKMVPEALRMVSPVINMRRTAIEDTEIGGQKIAKDEKMIMWYGAANRDPDIFENPDQFDIMRPNADKHLAFGHGQHKCLGQKVANMQLRISFEKILERFPNIQWTGKQTIAPNNLVHAISSLEVKLK